MRTRHAPPGSPLRQDRFASSPDIERGLLANLVAPRCAGLAREDAELMWWMQRQPMHALAGEILDRWPDRVDESAAHKLTEAEAAREALMRVFGDAPPRPSEIQEAEKQDRCRRVTQKALAHLPETLARLALDPALPVEDGWPEFFPRLCSTLHELKQLKTQEAESQFTHTTVSRALCQALHEARQYGGTHLLLHAPGTGASHAAARYCAINAGAFRFAAVPSGSDEVGFFRALCEGVGAASGLSNKAVNMRDRLQGVLRTKQLVLVLDGAQWLFPVSAYRFAIPNRLNWVLTELSEHDVAVVLLGNETFFDKLGLVEKRVNWPRTQFESLVQVKSLPVALPKEDVFAVAAAIMREADRAAQRRLADYMIAGPGYLHGGEPAARRARAIAQDHGHARVTLADMEQALESWGKPGLQALHAGLQRADAAKGRGHGRNQRPGPPLPAPGAGKSRSLIVTSSDVAQSGDLENLPAAHQPPSHKSGLTNGRSPRVRFAARRESETQRTPDLVTA